MVNFKNVMSSPVFSTVLKNLKPCFTGSVNSFCISLLKIYYSKSSKILLTFSKLQVWKISELFVFVSCFKMKILFYFVLIWFSLISFGLSATVPGDMEPSNQVSCQIEEKFQRWRKILKTCYICRESEN